MTQRRFTSVSAPFGALYVTAENGRIVRIDTKKPTIADGLQSDKDPALMQAAAHLKTYFDGADALPPIDCMEVFSPFQKRLYDRVRQIPYGQTCTVEELARGIGRAGSVHAVEMMCRCNPLWIVVPTHRVLRHEPDAKGRLSPDESLRRMEERYRRLNLAQALDKGDKRG